MSDLLWGCTALLSRAKGDPAAAYDPKDPGVLPSQVTAKGQRVRLPGQTRVTPEEYKEFLGLGHGDIFHLDIDWYSSTRMRDLCVRHTRALKRACQVLRHIQAPDKRRSQCCTKTLPQPLVRHACTWVARIIQTFAILPVKQEDEGVACGRLNGCPVAVSSMHPGTSRERTLQTTSTTA